ncbi:hypothetical protein P22_2535 [Propionispora sp. 2/2-37]|uniref:transcriptional regulator GutM n=1 Tax=Propionispora sp. 2/2-37 TaxID=1677858 RepID=UPI0006BB97D8|nr:transcriptional regulator GutM [Propionispora sp. 2/2-37]CUH96445.1 hypothetical protein P22_2535 [Propionispora sp. 2/2-37]
MERWMLIIFCFYVLQMVLTYFQVKNLRKTLAESRGKGIVGMGSKKRKLSAGNVVILISNEAGHIIEGRMMQGITVLARFREIANIKGHTVTELKEKILSQSAKKQDKAMLEAIEQIEKQIAKLKGNQDAPECTA